MVEVYVLVGFMIVTIIAAIEGFYSVRGIKNKQITQERRIKLYKSNILWGWAQTFACIAVLLIFHRSFRTIGFKMPVGISDDVNLIFAIATYIVSGGLLILLLYQILMFIYSEKYRIEIGKVMERKVTTSGEDIMIPRKKAEKRWFALCSVTAAVGEEIVYRGFLFYILASVFPSISNYIVLIVASAIFGVAHIYQGMVGIVKTALIGFMLGALYLVTGSLVPSIILHFVIDFAASFLYNEENMQ